LKTLSPAAGILSLLSVRNFLKKLDKDGLAHGHTSFRLQINACAPEEVLSTICCHGSWIRQNSAAIDRVVI
jgi:hypothetical protein